jgi:hypothetical protein
MSSIIKEIKDICKSKKLTFCEKFYCSKDTKTIMGEILFKEMLFLDYRDSEAGSNPREYNGLVKTNLEIFKSLLTHRNMFRFLHSGIIVSLTDTVMDEKDNSIKYSESCLTNGNQTRFVILLITLLKLFLGKNNLRDIRTKEYKDFLKADFNDEHKIMSIINRIKFLKVTQVVNTLKGNREYAQCFKDLDLKKFLNSRIRVQVNRIDQIVSDLEEDSKMDEYKVGTLIAEANNDTQKVKVDDIFGNKYKRDLQEFVFKEFLKEFKHKVEIEYRMGEVTDAVDKVHILTLLRPIVALGLLTKEKDIYKYTNQRAPIYKLFEKVLGIRAKASNTIEAISKLIPLLYNIRKDFVAPELDLLRKRFIREYTKKGLTGELDETVIHKEILSAKEDENLIEKIVRKSVGYNIEHVFPVLIYRTRKLFEESDGKVELKIKASDKPKYFKTLIEAIYSKYISQKLKGLPTSLTTFVRSSDFYETGQEAYITLKNTLGLEETDYIDRNKHILGVLRGRG